MSKIRIMSVAILVAVLTLTACVATPPRQTGDAPKADKDSSVTEEKEQAAEPEAPPAPEPGTLANPYPVGYLLTVGNTATLVDHYTVQARLVDADAQAALIAANQFNEVAPAGQKYVLLEYTITSLLPDKPVMPGVEAFSWSVADQDGKLYQNAVVVTPGESISGAPDLYTGQSYVGQAAYLVPATTTTLYFSAFGGYVAL